MLSVLIPARNEVYLQQTIDSVLNNAEGEIEVVAVLDGYKPEPPIREDKRVVLIEHEVAQGQRQSVNEAARKAKGDYLMKLDAHCAVDKGFDVKLIADYKEGEVHIPRMYNLDKLKFAPKMHKRTDYMYIGMNEKGQLRSLYYSGNEWKKWHRERNDILVDETMGCMGPCRFMSTKTFWDLGGCDEEHGSWGSEGIEWACKAWLSGGRLMVNKKTWFAHWFRGSDGGFPYKIRQSEVDKARIHAENLWLQDKWPKQTRTFQWLLDKFNPPGKELLTKEIDMDQHDFNKLNVEFYHHIHVRRNHPKYRGITILKMPNDLQLYHEIVMEKKPDLIIEIGTKWGGCSLFLQDQLDLLGKGGKVVTVDVKDIVAEKDPRITYLLGDSISEPIRKQLNEMAKGKQVMIILDGNHNRTQVKWELYHFKNLVSVGQYIVLEDCFSRVGNLAGPGQARDWFLKGVKRFEQTDLDKKFIVGFNRGGYLLRTK